MERQPCRACVGEIKITYKEPETLGLFLSDRAKILPRKKTKLCAKHQRKLKREIKIARYLMLLPYTTITTEITEQDIREYFGD